MLRAALTRIFDVETEGSDLKARLNQNSTNSSKLPSSDAPATPRTPKKPPAASRRAAYGEVEEGDHRAILEEPPASGVDKEKDTMVDEKMDGLDYLPKALLEGDDATKSLSMEIAEALMSAEATSVSVWCGARSPPS